VGRWYPQFRHILMIENTSGGSYMDVPLPGFTVHSAFLQGTVQTQI